MSDEINILTDHDHVQVVARAPGRINLIGEHTDYNDGYVLPAAIDKSTKVRLTKTDASNVRLIALDINDSIELDIHNLQTVDKGWANYLIGVMGELQKMGCVLGGFECSIQGDVPIGSGMSSSASLQCSLVTGLNDMFLLGLTPMQLIKAAQMAEHNYVGIKCGIMDQFASVMGRSDHAMLLDCRSMQYEYIPLQLERHEIVLLNSNVTHELASSEYNVRRQECEEGVKLLQKEYQDISSLRDVNMDMLIQSRHQLPANVWSRCHHVVSENNRVLQVVDALQSNRLDVVGDCINQSHDSLSKDYNVSCPELDFLSKVARSKDYVLGSRMMGGGFGGCTINLIKRGYKDQMIDEVRSAYHKQYSIDAIPYHVEISDGARVL